MRTSSPPSWLPPLLSTAGSATCQATLYKKPAASSARAGSGGCTGLLLYRAPESCALPELHTTLHRCGSYDCAGAGALWQQRSCPASGWVLVKASASKDSSRPGRENALLLKAASKSGGANL